jgi:hypothetical protein
VLLLLLAGGSAVAVLLLLLLADGSAVAVLLLLLLADVSAGTGFLGMVRWGGKDFFATSGSTSNGAALLPWSGA